MEGADHYLGPAAGGECQKESWNERIHGMFNNQEMADIRFAVNDGTAHVVFKVQIVYDTLQGIGTVSLSESRFFQLQYF